jgi:transposase-like protein
MSKRPVKSVSAARRRGRRTFPEEFKRDAVQMLLDGHTAQSVVERLGLSSANLLYRWKREQLERCGPAATSLEAPSDFLMGEFGVKTAGHRRASRCGTWNCTSRFWDC